jgi:hypothetical protein
MISELFHRSLSTEVKSQLDLDAQFARSLAMQDEQEQQERNQRHQVPYQARVRRARPQHGEDQFGQGGQAGYQQQGQFQQYQQQPGQPGQNPAGMLAVEEKINQFAEGKLWHLHTSNPSPLNVQSVNRPSTRCSARPRQSTPNSKLNTTPRALRPTDLQSPSGVKAAPNRGETLLPRAFLPREEDEEGSRTGGEHGMIRRESRATLRGIELTPRSFSSQSTDPGPTPISPHTASNPPFRQAAPRWQPSDAYDDPSPPIRVNSSGSRPEAGGRRSPGVGSPDKGQVSGKIDPGE